MHSFMPLHYAAYNGHANNICGALIKAGARLDAVSSTGHTP
jgi:ankyrin repeat protein